MKLLKMICHYSKAVLDNNGTILCDDYNLGYAPGVKTSH